MNDQPPPSIPQATVTSPKPAKKTGLAIASLVLGIFGPSLLAVSAFLLWAFDTAGGIRPAVGLTLDIVAFVVWVVLPVVAPMLAIVFGVAALNRISKSGGRIIGRGQAVAGLFTGAASLVLYTAMILPALHSAREKDRLVQCLKNMQQISVAIGMYADAHDGNIPRIFEDLQPYATNLSALLICPSAKDKSRASYQITFGGEKWEGWNTNDGAIDAIVVIESASNHRWGQNVLYNDGHVSWSNSQDSVKSD